MVELLKPFAICSGETEWENCAEIFCGVWKTRLGTFHEAWPRPALAMHLTASASCLQLVLFTRCCRWVTALSRKDNWAIGTKHITHESIPKRELTKFLLHLIFCAKASSFNPAPNIYARSKKNWELLHTSHSAYESVSFMPPSRKTFFEIAQTFLSQEEHVCVKRDRRSSRISSLGRNVGANHSNNIKSNINFGSNKIYQLIHTTIWFLFEQ